jgi:hypothetical protein
MEIALFCPGLWDSKFGIFTLFHLVWLLVNSLPGFFSSLLFVEEEKKRKEKPTSFNL